MKIVAFMETTVRYPRKARDRAENSWNLEKNKDLREAIEKCLKTHRTVIHEVPGGNIYRVKPAYPLIPSAMKDPRYKNVIKVRIAVFTQAWSLGVKVEPNDGIAPATARKKQPRAKTVPRKPQRREKA